MYKTKKEIKKVIYKHSFEYTFFLTTKCNPKPQKLF